MSDQTKQIAEAVRGAVESIRADAARAIEAIQTSHDNSLEEQRGNLRDLDTRIETRLAEHTSTATKALTEHAQKMHAGAVDALAKSALALVKEAKEEAAAERAETAKQVEEMRKVLTEMQHQATAAAKAKAEAEAETAKAQTLFEKATAERAAAERAVEAFNRRGEIEIAQADYNAEWKRRRTALLKELDNERVTKGDAFDAAMGDAERMINEYRPEILAKVQEINDRAAGDPADDGDQDDLPYGDTED